MNDLVRYLDGIETRLKSVEDFAVAETPLLIQEFLAWEFIKNLSISVVCGVILLVLFVVFCKFLLTNFTKAGEKPDPVDDWIAKGFITLIFLILAWAPFLGFYTSAQAVGKISIAPRVYVVEKAATLLKAIR